MPEFYTTENVIEDKFVFISYSHRDQQLVTDTATYLIGEGVRLWYDRSLTPGDEWRTEVERLLRHDNCCAVILFCSPDAILSINVARERAIALEEQEKRGKAAYPLFIVNVPRTDQPISYMQLLKGAFDRLDEAAVDKDFPLDSLRVFMRIVGDDPICSMANEPDFAAHLLAGLHRKVPMAINKNNILVEEMGERSQRDPIITLPLGHRTVNGATLPITWRFLYYNGNEGVFLSEQILEERAGGAELDMWLGGSFAAEAFTREEQAYPAFGLRLLTQKELADIKEGLLAAGTEWWLSDRRGSLQMIIREDGSLYRNGYNNKLFRKGVRPVLTLDINKAKELVLQQQN